MYAATGGYPYFIQAYGKTVWDLAPRSPITAADVAVAAPEAERELAVGFFGSRYERATPGERDYLRAMADAAGPEADAVGSVATSDVAGVLGKKPQSLSPARDALLKKGLIYSGERGRIAFTVPHFGRYLAPRPDPGHSGAPSSAYCSVCRIQNAVNAASSSASTTKTQCANGSEPVAALTTNSTSAPPMTEAHDAGDRAVGALEASSARPIVSVPPSATNSSTLAALTSATATIRPNIGTAVP